MDDPSHPNIAGVCWEMSQINQKMFNKIGGLLRSHIPKRSLKVNRERSTLGTSQKA